MRSVDEAVILVTGSTDGLGEATARDLAAAGATVLLHGRGQERGDAAVREIREETGNDRLRYYLADFSSLEEVHRLADEVMADHDRLDVLVNNAGVGAGRRGETSRDLRRDGYELRLAVNYLAPFLLTRLLLPLVQRSTPSRIVNVASAGQSPISFDDVMLERGYDGMRAYAQSKLALIMFAFDLAEELEDTSVTANSLHPASLMATKMVFETSAARRAACGRVPTRRFAWPSLPSWRGSPAGTSTGNARLAPTSRPTTRKPAPACGDSRRS